MSDSRVVPLMTLFVLLGLGMGPSPALGQIDLKPGFRLGVNFSNMGGDADAFAEGIAEVAVQNRAESFESPDGEPLEAESAEASPGRRGGLMVSGFVVVDFPGPFALQPELRYLQRGYEYDMTLTLKEQNGPETFVLKETETLKTDYIEVPVFARYDLPISRFTPHIMAGPTVGVNVIQEFEREDSSGETNTRDTNDGIKTADFGLEFGAGVDIKLADSAFLVDAQYGLGLTGVNDDDTDLSLKHRALIVTIGFAF